MVAASLPFPAGTTIPAQNAAVNSSMGDTEAMATDLCKLERSSYPVLYVLWPFIEKQSISTFLKL